MDERASVLQDAPPMTHFYVLGYVEVPTNVTGRGSITNTERIPVYGDDPRHYPALVALALNPQMIEWLITTLDTGRVGREDGFVRELRGLRDEMQMRLWEGAAE